MSIKRYALFAFDIYYPCGGPRDYIDQLDRLPTASEAHDLVMRGRAYEFDRIVVFDRLTGQEVDFAAEPAE